MTNEQFRESARLTRLDMLDTLAEQLSAFLSDPAHAANHDGLRLSLKIISEQKKALRAKPSQPL